MKERRFAVNNPNFMAAVDIYTEILTINGVHPKDVKRQRNKIVDTRQPRMFMRFVDGLTLNETPTK